jgi:hypothetical protein
MKSNRQKSVNKDSPTNTQINASNNTASLNVTRDSKISCINSPFRLRQESIATDKDMLKDNFYLNNSYLNRSKSPFSLSSRSYNFIEIANQNGENNAGIFNGCNKNFSNNNFMNNNVNNNNTNNNNHNGNTTIDLNFNISSHLKQNDSIISVNIF